MGGSRAASSLPEPSFLFASPHRSYDRCASRARSAVSRRISKNQYTRVRRREKGPRSKKKKRRKEKTYSISRLPRRSSPCLPLFFSPEYRLSRLSFRFASFFFPIILLRSELRAIYPTPSSSSPARSFAIRRCERAIEKRRKEKERPIGFNEGNLVSAQVGDRAGPVEARESLFSQKRAARALV